MIISLILLIVGFGLLIKGADIFVDGASSTAQNLKVSKILIGLTIVAFGTSAPELAVSMQALASHNTDMVLGNVIGSCILNTLLILGIAAIIRPIKAKDNTVRKELPITLLISTLLAVLMLDIKLGNSPLNQITRSDAIVILLFFSVFVYYLINLALKKKEEKEEIEKPKYKMLKSLLFTGLGLAGIIYGSDLVVKHATIIATTLGISERVISLTVIALGTSLPELVTTIVSAKKGEQDILLGNIIGSNIFNICVVLGLPVAIFGTITPGSFSSFDIIALVGSSLLLFIFSLSKRTINRFEGVIMFLSFIAYYVLVFIF
ncbi:MAG: calcium/sodium antiporter [Bacilli bacterium]|nr:calcium/sodium antiporter [Bacilli bacterium]